MAVPDYAGAYNKMGEAFGNTLTNIGNYYEQSKKNEATIQAELKTENEATARKMKAIDEIYKASPEIAKAYSRDQLMKMDENELKDRMMAVAAVKGATMEAQKLDPKFGAPGENQYFNIAFQAPDMVKEITDGILKMAKDNAEATAASQLSSIQKGATIGANMAPVKEGTVVGGVGETGPSAIVPPEQTSQFIAGQKMAADAAALNRPVSQSQAREAITSSGMRPERANPVAYENYVKSFPTDAEIALGEYRNKNLALKKDKQKADIAKTAKDDQLRKEYMALQAAVASGNMQLARIKIASIAELNKGKAASLKAANDPSWESYQNSGESAMNGLADQQATQDYIAQVASAMGSGVEKTYPSFGAGVEAAKKDTPEGRAKAAYDAQYRSKNPKKYPEWNLLDTKLKEQMIARMK